MFLKYATKHSIKDLEEIHFEVIAVSLISYDANWHSTMHSHDYTEILHILDGEGFIQTEHGRLPVQKNNTVIIQKYVEHTEHTSITKPLKYLVIGVRGPELALPNYSSETGLISLDDFDKKLSFWFDCIIQECEIEGNHSSFIIDYLVNALLLKLTNIPGATLNPEKSHPLSPSVSLVKNYIENHYSKQITLDLLEKRSHISKYHLSHLFKKEVGISPINYLIKVRFSHAKLLLETTNFSILQIAELTGFASVNFFTSKFKATFGMTPTAHRLKYRKENNSM